MKNIFAPLAPLKKIRPSRKLLLVGGYLLVITLLLAAAVWRGYLPNPLTLFAGQEAVPPQEQPVEAETQAPPAVEGETAGENPPAGEDSTPVLTLPQTPMVWPLEGTILAGHHEVYRIGNTLRAHVGVDIEAAAESEVKAAWPGVVERVTEDARLGWLLEIRHGGDYLTQYANLLEEPYVEVGDEVQQGQALGKVGGSAALDAVEGTHLHFAIYRQGEALDPVQVISPR
ncbi:MAG: peptidoglycan DD-metalloendopeptidase family protein [Dethiobacteraceae bacterium]|nr:M23 family metallopeptidase [Bacillota bacterium]